MAWLTGGYTKRKPITITGGSSGAQTDFQLKLAVSYAAAMQGDFDDLRFTQSDGTTLIDAWSEVIVTDTSATVWVEFPTTPANTVEQTYYMYYGNAGAASDWDIGATFLLGDDFSGSAGVPDTGLWTVEKKGSTSATAALDGAGNLELAGAASVISSGSVKSIATFTNDICIRTKRYDSSQYYRDISLGYGDLCGTTPSGWWHTTFSNGYIFFAQDDTDSRIIEMTAGSYSNLTAVTDLPNHGSWRTYDMIYDSSGKLDFIVDGTSYINVTDTTFLSNAKNILLSQGEYSNGFGGLADIDYMFVRKYATNPPTYAFGSEESVPTGGSRPPRVFYGPFAGPFGGPI